MSAERKPAGTNIQQLRELMLFEEQQELEELRARLDGLEGESVDRLAEDIAAALNRRKQLGDESFGELVAAMQAGTESAIQRSVSEDKSRLTTALFPIMGPAIRNYVTDLFRGMVSELNESIKNTTSVERIKWRAEARLAGKNYSEYVLLKTRSFKIEEVYLMQRDTGLLLMHATTNSDDEARGEADLVSGMFTAIRSFVKDSFVHPESETAADDGEELDSFTFGEREVLIEVGPSMVLAAVAHGVPPTSVRDDLKEILENLHAELQGRLDRFSGDMEVLESGRPTLRQALMENQAASSSSGSGMWRAWLVLGLLAAGIGTWMFFNAREQNHWDKFETSLRDEPGIAVTAVSKGWWKQRRVTGLRDPLAIIPAEFGENFEIKPEKTKFQFELMESLDPEIVALRKIKRADERKQGLAKVDATTDATGVNSAVFEMKSELSTEVTKIKARSQRVLESLVRSQFGDVEGLTLNFTEAGEIIFGGTVIEPAFSSLNSRLQDLKKLDGVDISGIKNGTAERISELQKEIAQMEIPYHSGSLDRGDDRKIDQILVRIKELDSLATFTQKSFHFQILAHPLIGANRDANREVEKLRAEQIRERLVTGGVAVSRIETKLSEDMNRAGMGVTVLSITESLKPND